MSSYNQEIQLIKKVLQENPKGMTVTDISRKIKINRNSVAKYLDIMKTSGHVDMISFGPAKVFFPSKRVPILDMLNYASDLICIFDEKCKITMINDAFLDFINTCREEIIGQFINEALPENISDDGEILIAIEEALKGRHFTKEIDFEEGDDQQYFSIKIVPTTFEDGKHGASFIVKNITQRVIAEKTLKESEENIKKILSKMNRR